MAAVVVLLAIGGEQEGEVGEGRVGEERVQQKVALVLMRTILIPNHRGLSRQGVAPTPAR